jgi:hypothetical protein
MMRIAERPGAKPAQHPLYHLHRGETGAVTDLRLLSRGIHLDFELAIDSSHRCVKSRFREGAQFEIRSSRCGEERSKRPAKARGMSRDAKLDGIRRTLS